MVLVALVGCRIITEKKNGDNDTATHFPSYSRCPQAEMKDRPMWEKRMLEYAEEVIKIFIRCYRQFFFSYWIYLMSGEFEI